MKQVLIKNKNETFNIDLEELLEILEKYKIKVFDIKKIKYGWKNICFEVTTINQKKLFVKCFDTKKSINNEIEIYKLIKNNIDVPKLFYAIRTNKLNILVYQLITNSTPFFEYERKMEKINGEKIFINIAITLAKIHNIKSEEYNELLVPIFSNWYNIFLTKNNIIKQLGYKRKNKIEYIKNKFEKYFPIIESYKSFSHCDFKSNNILIKNDDMSIWIIDWEFASYCYSFLDIGQLFREKNIYKNNKFIQLFEQVYNEFAIKKLPEKWYLFIKLVDLGNLLEMLSRKNDIKQNKKVLKIIDDYLEYLLE